MWAFHINAVLSSYCNSRPLCHLWLYLPVEMLITPVHRLLKLSSQWQRYLLMVNCKFGFLNRCSYIITTLDMPSVPHYQTMGSIKRNGSVLLLLFFCLSHVFVVSTSTVCTYYENTHDMIKVWSIVWWGWGGGALFIKYFKYLGVNNKFQCSFKNFTIDFFT